jgi:hypothetical protein
VIGPEFGISTAALLSILQQQPPAPSLAPPRAEPEWMHECAEQMTSDSWFEVACAAAEERARLAPGAAPWLGREARARVARALGIRAPAIGRPGSLRPSEGLRRWQG